MARRLSILLGSATASIAVALTAAIAFRISRANGSTPELDIRTLPVETVKRGAILRRVQGVGTLVTQNRAHVPAPSAGRVLRIGVSSGSAVNPDTVVVILRSPELEQQALEAAWNVRNGGADLANLKAQGRAQEVSYRSDLAALQAEYRDAKLKNDRDQALHRDGLLLDLDYTLSCNAVQDLATRITLEQDKEKATKESLDDQLTTKEAAVTELRRLLQVRQEQVAALTVRARSAGIVDQVLVEVGQQINAGADLVVIIPPRILKVDLAVADAQAADVDVGQSAAIDTGGGRIMGHVVRIDPTVTNGTRIVEVGLDSPPPGGLAPGGTVEGTIETGRGEDVLYVRRQTRYLKGEATVFRISPDDKEATRVKVRFGRVTSGNLEIESGVKAGDRIILSDVAALDGHDRIRLR